MKFFDKIRTTGRTVAGKSAELAEAARLRAALFRLENELQEKELELGRHVYAVRCEGREDGGRTEALCGEVRALRERRAALQRRLALAGAKGASPCPACGEPVVPGACFCSACGRALAGDGGGPERGGAAAEEQ